MRQATSTHCDIHADRFECPDALLAYSPKFDEYGIIVHDGGSSVSAIAFCPWCGTELPPSRRDRWFEEIERLGFTRPDDPNIPARFHSDDWWREHKDGGR